MSEEKLFSEIGSKEPFVKKNYKVIRNTSRSYPAYWNGESWGGLLEAKYYENDVPTVANGETVDYDEVVGLKNK